MFKLKRFSFEIRVIIALLFAVIIVSATGILSYKIMTDIVNGINEKAKPDVKLALLKSILSDLSDAESSVKSYSISNNEDYLSPFYTSIASIDNKMDELSNLSQSDLQQQPTIDSISLLIKEKFSILNELLSIQHNNRVDETIKTISKKLDDTYQTTSNENASTKHSTIFQQIFGRNKEKQAETPSIEDVQEELAKIKKQETNITKVITTKQLDLAQKDKMVMDKIRILFQELEDQEKVAILQKTTEAKKMVKNAKQLIAGFCLTVSLLLITVGVIIFSYIRKKNDYEKALQHAKVEAENLAQTKEIFLANMSHEIRTPMNAIAGFTEQVLQTSLNTDQKEQLEIVKKSADHLLNIINDILDFSKLGAGKLEIEKIGFYPREVFNEVVILMKPQVTKKQLRLTYTVEENIPQIIVGDVVRLKQILLNIISNAIKFTEKGEIKIHAFAITSAEKKLQLKVKVVDTGIGISKAKLNSIFNEFEQAETSITRKYGGTGLGLAITKKLIELQQGGIQIESKEAIGTTVSFFIPYLIGSSNDIPKDNLSINYTALKGKSILIADDEEYNRMLLATILKKWEMSFTQVSNGKEAVEELKQNHYDIILMDVRMPVMNGIEASSYIRNHCKGKKALTPIIALTAATAKEDIERYIDAGMSAFLYKPFKEQELYDKILLVLNQRMATEVFSLHENKELIQEVVKETVPSVSRPNYNLNDLYRLANGDENFVQEMISVFIYTTKEGVEKIRQAFEEKAWLKIADQAHKIVAPCTHFEAFELAKLLREIETRTRNQKDLDQLPSLIDETEKATKNLVNMLEKELEKKLV